MAHIHLSPSCQTLCHVMKTQDVGWWELHLVHTEWESLIAGLYPWPFQITGQTKICAGLFFFFSLPSLCQLLSLVLVLRGWISRRWEGFSLLTLLISYRAVKYPSWNEKEINALLTPDCKWTTNPWTGLLLIFQLFLPHSVFFFYLALSLGIKKCIFHKHD